MSATFRAVILKAPISSRLTCEIALLGPNWAELLRPSAEELRALMRHVTLMLEHCITDEPANLNAARSEAGPQ